MAPRTRIAVLPVRDGVLPAGGVDAAVDAFGAVLVVGTGAVEAASLLAGSAADLSAWETPGYAPGAWATPIAAFVADVDIVVLPASPDGRDLAPRIAAVLARPLLAGALDIRDDAVVCAVHGGTAQARHHVTGPLVATLQPGVTGLGVHPHGAAPRVTEVHLDADADQADAQVVTVHPPDVATMDLSEAPRILGGGAGLESAERFEELAAVATALGASAGATRVITDRNWVPHTRQIGTTGVVVDPRLYLAFGISGAVQHTAGLGDPDHVISINTDPHCPMMSMADLAVVADANATLAELAALLGVAESAGTDRDQGPETAS
ncbi:MAG: mycofactocin-associated electron transfer flavoprotein alpha subunit [Actinomycetes bacterium]